MDKATMEKKYMTMVKMCGMLCGIWPDQSKLSKYAMRVFVYVFASTSFFTQVANLVCFYSADLLIWQLLFLIVIIGTILKHTNYIINNKKYKELLDAIWDDWATNRTKGEFDIMEQYAVKAGIFCRIYVEPSLMPIILDVILPKNESRDIVYIFPAYYIIDDRKYRTLISVHMACVCFSSFYVFSGCDASYMFIVQHACGQLAVTGYRFKNAILDLSNVKDPSDMQDESHRRVLLSIRAHQHAINSLRELNAFVCVFHVHRCDFSIDDGLLVSRFNGFENSYVKTIDDSHSVYLFVGIIFVIIAFSVTLVKISTYTEISAQYLKDSLFFFCQIVHLGFISLQGQFIVNSNDEVVQSIHDASWYNANKRTQLLFVLVIRSCLNPPTLSAGGLFTLNLESFSKIMKTSFSYFTVLKSA